ncbi:unnamed protein product, partial [Onchocerca ochengi]|uniref:Secreted protein n=1 Tax=Onchocerca ochengi TaxID=42157 RepID=A0A182ERP7_ONCOC
MLYNYMSCQSWYHIISGTLLLLITRCIQAEFFNEHKPGRSLIVLSAPSV